MKKKKTLTPQEIAAKQAARAAAKEQINKAIDTFAHLKTPKEWHNVLKDAGKARFTFGCILTRCQKKIALEAFKNKTPFHEIKPEPLFSERTMRRYFQEFEKLLISEKFFWTIMAILSDEMFFNLIFFEA